MKLDHAFVNLEVTHTILEKCSEEFLENLCIQFCMLCKKKKKHVTSSSMQSAWTGQGQGAKCIFLISNTEELRSR